MIEKTWNPDSTLDRMTRQAIRQHRPLSCTLELTYRCNFRCPMCYVRMTDEQAAPYGRLRTAEEWLDMARQLLDAGVLNLNLTGGECAVYPEFPALYEAISQMGFRVHLMSNAAAYTDELRALFTRYPPCTVTVTLYGGSAETYRAVTGDPKGLERALENIRFLRGIGVPVQLNYTMVRQNARDYPKVSRISRELGVPLTLITDITGHQRNPAFSDAASCRLSPAERACVACHPPEEVDTALADAKELERELEHFVLPAPPAEPLPPRLDPCIGSYTGCTIFWNGDMQTCVSMTGAAPVKPFDIGFETAWAQLKAQHAALFQQPAACQACGMAADCMHNCAGRRMEGTGSTRTPDPLLCQFNYLLRLCRARQNNPEITPAPACT